MKVVMLDTNVIIDLFRNETKAKQKLLDFKDYTFAISFLVYAEFMCGTQVNKKKDSNKFLRNFLVLDFDLKAQNKSKILMQKYFTGRENNPNDLLIAAHALSLKYPIITNNAKDFIFSEVKSYHYTKASWF